MNAFDRQPDLTPFAIRMPDVRFGDGVAGDLQEVLTQRRISKPLLVTDRGIEEAGILDSVTDSLSTPVKTYFASTEPSTDDFDDVPTDSVDGIVALGGDPASTRRRSRRY